MANSNFCIHSLPGVICNMSPQCVIPLVFFCSWGVDQPLQLSGICTSFTFIVLKARFPVVCVHAIYMYGSFCLLWSLCSYLVICMS